MNSFIRDKTNIFTHQYQYWSVSWPLCNKMGHFWTLRAKIDPFKLQNQPYLHIFFTLMHTIWMKSYWFVLIYLRVIQVWVNMGVLSKWMMVLWHYPLILAIYDVYEPQKTSFLGIFGHIDWRLWCIKDYLVQFRVDMCMYLRLKQISTFLKPLQHRNARKYIWKRHFF